MRTLRRVVWWLRGRFRREALRQRVEEEIRTHIALDAERLRAEGMGAEEARRRAEERFGNRDRIRAQMLAAADAAADSTRSATPIADAASTMRHAARSLAATPGATLLVLTTLATAVAVHALMMGVAGRILFGDAGVRSPDRVASVFVFYPGLPDGMHEQPMHGVLLQGVERAEAVQAAAGFKAGYFNLTGRGRPRRLDGMRTTPRLFDVAGVRPLLGPGFADVKTGDEHVVVLSWGLWQQLGADPALVGSTLQLNEEPYEVVGVMPPDFRFPRGEDVPSTFRFPRRPDLWVPYAPPERGPSDLGVVARLRPGATMDQLRGELEGVLDAFKQHFGIESISFSLRAVLIRNQAAGQARPALVLLLLATSLVVLVAVGNVAGVGIARGEARAPELAVRMALGSGRRGVAGLILAESLVLGVLTAGASLGVASLLASMIRRFAPPGLPGLDLVQVTWGMAGTALGLSLLGAFALALGAAVRVRRWRVADVLRGARTAGSRTTRRSGLVLVAVEVAMTLVLLSGGAVLTRSILKLTQVDPGFDAEHVFTAELTLPEATYPDAARARSVQRAQKASGPEPAVPRFQRALIRELGARPGVEVAAVANPLPFSGGQESSVYWIEGMDKPDQMPLADYTVVSEGYFRAMRIPVLQGRGFSGDDRHGSEPVVVVSRSLAERFPGGRALGARMKLGGAPDAPYPWLRVVGVVGDVKRDDLAGAARPEMYVHMSQGGYTSMSTMRLVVRTAGGLEPGTAAAAVRDVLETMDPDVPLERAAPMADLLADATSRARYTARLVLIFSALALLITALGLYSAIAYAVETRRRELAVRVAVGASSWRILATVLGETAFALAGGLVVGGAGAYLASGLLQGLVFGVTPFELPSLAVAGAILSLTVLAAAQGPARASLRADAARVLSRE